MYHFESEWIFIIHRTSHETLRCYYHNVKMLNVHARKSLLSLYCARHRVCYFIMFFVTCFNIYINLILKIKQVLFKIYLNKFLLNFTSILCTFFK